MPDSPFKKTEENKNIKETKGTDKVRNRFRGKRDKTEVVKKTRAEILTEFGGLESNIPVNHSYWRLQS